MILAASGQKKEGMREECDAQRHRYWVGLMMLLSSSSAKTPVPGEHLPPENSGKGGFKPFPCASLSRMEG